MKHTDERLAELVRLGVMQGKYPETVFTYMSVEHMDRIEEIFKRSALWFSYPKDFNDPFDCRVYPVVPSNEQLAAYLSKKAENATPEDYAAIKGGIDSAGGGELLTRQAIDDVMNTYGVRCFTPKPDNLLMWAHYGNAHSGICLEFNVLKDSRFFVNPIWVDYQEEYPKTSFLDPTFTTTMLRTKSEQWRYENEFRVFKKGDGYHHFDSLALRSVIFGCKATDENIDKIVEMVRCKPCFDHVKFYKAETNEKAFKLYIKAI